MKKCISFLLTIFFSAFLGACASLAPPSAEEIEKADYGILMSQENAQITAQAFLDKHLKDPRSAQYEWGESYKAWLRRGIIHGGGKIFGYRLDVDVNAKNSYGGYTGFKKYVFMFYNGAIKVVYAEQTGEIYYDSQLGKL